MKALLTLVAVLASISAFANSKETIRCTENTRRVGAVRELTINPHGYSPDERDTGLWTIEFTSRVVYPGAKPKLVVRSVTSRQEDEDSLKSFFENKRQGVYLEINWDESGAALFESRETGKVEMVCENK